MLMEPKYMLTVEGRCSIDLKKYGFEPLAAIGQKIALERIGKEYTIDAAGSVRSGNPETSKINPDTMLLHGGVCYGEGEGAYHFIGRKENLSNVLSQIIAEDAKPENPLKKLRDALFTLEPNK